MPDENTSLIDAFIEDQQRLTAVERFSQQHERDGFTPDARQYRDLLPATAPAPGEQYAFEVNLDRCSGCKACVTACHSLNGLDDNETWREVGLLIAPPQRRGWDGRLALSQVERTSSTGSSLQHVTTACHHCVDPACLNGCPVLAYEKDSATGIVRHLDDQCIGCQYCVLKCPYDVPKYNPRLGIVRKCDLCANRLAVGEAPACAQACPSEAIRITKVQTGTVTIEFRERGKSFLSGAPAGNYTLPTTQYRSAGVHACASLAGDEHAESAAHDPQLIAADFATLFPQPAHWPLVVMLVLSQASVGVAAFGAWQHPVDASVLMLALGLAVLGLGASVFHLGRPLGAWRAFLNLKRSWMSREIVVFGMFPPLLMAALVLAHGTPFSKSANLATLLQASLAIGAPIIGLIGVFCSVMIYHDTRRILWNLRRSLPLFFGTMVILGAAGVAMFRPSPRLALVIVAASIAKFVVEILIVRHVTDHALTPLKKTALLITGKFPSVAFTRLVCGVLGGIGLPLMATLNVFPTPMPAAMIAFVLLLVGELLERFLFFTTVDAPKMPGGLPA